MFGRERACRTAQNYNADFWQFWLRGGVGCGKGRGKDCVRMDIRIKMSAFARGKLLRALLHHLYAL